MLQLSGFLKGGQNGQKLLDWSQDMETALVDIKVVELAQAACRAFPSEVAALSLATDASSTAVSAFPDGSSWQHLSFF